jgi:hypothetical protein
LQRSQQETSSSLWKIFDRNVEREEQKGLRKSDGKQGKYPSRAFSFRMTIVKIRHPNPQKCSKVDGIEQQGPTSQFYVQVDVNRRYHQRNESEAHAQGCKQVWIRFRQHLHHTGHQVILCSAGNTGQLPNTELPDYQLASGEATR